MNDTTLQQENKNFTLVMNESPEMERGKKKQPKNRFNMKK